MIKNKINLISLLLCFLLPVHCYGMMQQLGRQTPKFRPSSKVLGKPLQTAPIKTLPISQPKPSIPLKNVPTAQPIPKLEFTKPSLLQPMQPTQEMPLVHILTPEELAHIGQPLSQSFALSIEKANALIKEAKEIKILGKKPLIDSLEAFIKKISEHNKLSEEEMKKFKETLVNLEKKVQRAKANQIIKKAKQEELEKIATLETTQEEAPPILTEGLAKLEQEHKELKARKKQEADVEQKKLAQQEQDKLKKIEQEQKDKNEKTRLAQIEAEKTEIARIAKAKEKKLLQDKKAQELAKAQEEQAAAERLQAAQKAAEIKRQQELAQLAEEQLKKEVDAEWELFEKEDAQLKRTTKEIIDLEKELKQLALEQEKSAANKIEYEKLTKEIAQTHADMEHLEDIQRQKRLCRRGRTHRICV